MSSAMPVSTRPNGYRQALIILVIGLLLSFGISAWIWHQANIRAETRFHYLAERQVERIRDRLELLVYGLKGMRGLFLDNPESVDEAAFHHYLLALNLPSELPGTLAWSHVERIRSGNAITHLNKHRIDSYHRMDGQQLPPRGQEDWVLRLVEPHTLANDSALGLDIASEPLRRSAAAEAMRTGRPTITAPLRLLQDPAGQPGVILFLPVYQGEQTPDNAIGWVDTVVNVDELLDFLRSESRLSDTMDITLVDSADRDHPLFRLGSGGSAATTTLHEAATIGFGGRQWQVILTARPGIYAPADRWLPALALTAGTLLSLLVAGLLALSIRSRNDAQGQTALTTRSLQEREALLQSTLASLEDWVFVLDEDGRVQDCHAPEQFDRWQPRSAFIGRPLADALPPPAAAELRTRLQEAVNNGRAGFTFSLGAGTHAPRFSARLCVRHRSDGGTEGVTLVAHDITHEHEQARELRESEEKFRLLFTEAAQAIMLTRHGHYVDANPAALTLFGMPNLAALQHASIGTISPLMQPDGRPSLDAIRDLMRKAAQEGPQHCEWMFRRLSDGASFPAEVHTSHLDLDGVPHFLSMITDLSARKQAELTLIRSRDAAEAATREKSEFLATMSHEIRTPMNGVLGMAQLLAGSNLNPEQREYLNTIQQSGEALLTIINDILDFSKIEAGKLSFEEVPFDLQIAVDETCELLLPEIRAKNLELTLDIDPATPFHVIGDPGRFRQILLNYLSNALKFTQQGGITVSLQAREGGRGAVLYELAVADTGIGVSQEKQQLLFQRFSQAENHSMRRFGGTGLGLAICKALVERMGGSVSMSSTPGHGSIFRATFWMSTDPDNGHEAVPAMASALRGQPVLVVTRHTASRESLLKGLSNAGLAVHGAGSMTEALNAVAAQVPRYALINDDLPADDSEKLMAALRQNDATKDTVLVLLSSHPERNDHAFCRNHGISACLPRPARLAWIVSCLNILSAGERDGIITRHTLASHQGRGKALPALRPGIRVLLAEDNTVNQKVAARMLEKMGCHVDLVANGLEALMMVAQLPYDVVLMDVQMPEMDGITATRSLRAQGFVELPVIALTANSRDADREECRAAGMSDFLAKPIRYEDLHTCLSRWL